MIAFDAPLILFLHQLWIHWIPYFCKCVTSCWLFHLFSLCNYNLALTGNQPHRNQPRRLPLSCDLNCCQASFDKLRRSLLVTHRTLNLCYLVVIRYDCNVMMPNVSPEEEKPGERRKRWKICWGDDENVKFCVQKMLVISSIHKQWTWRNLRMTFRFSQRIENEEATKSNRKECFLRVWRTIFLLPLG